MLRISLLVLMLALLTSCGGGSNHLTIDLEGMRFHNAEVHVQAGQPMTLRLVNKDSYAHAFDIDAFGIHRSLAARETVEVIFTPEQAGQYRFYCGSPGHEQAGMVGVLVVGP